MQASSVKMWNKSEEKTRFWLVQNCETCRIPWLYRILTLHFFPCDICNLMQRSCVWVFYCWTSFKSRSLFSTFLLYFFVCCQWELRKLIAMNMSGRPHLGQIEYNLHTHTHKWNGVNERILSIMSQCCKVTSDTQNALRPSLLVLLMK